MFCWRRSGSRSIRNATPSGIPLGVVIIAALPFAALAAAVAFALTFAATHRRSGGVDFFDLRLGASPRRRAASRIAALLIAPLLRGIACYIDDAAAAQTWTESCADLDRKLRGRGDAHRGRHAAPRPAGGACIPDAPPARLCDLAAAALTVPPVQPPNSPSNISPNASRSA